jgi:methylthioribose-1-phosphate isomerase
MKPKLSSSSKSPDNARAFASPRLGGLPPTIEWPGGDACELRLLDQTLLPREVRVRTCRTVEDVWQAIRELCVRGAPAIGVAAGFGMCLGTRAATGDDPAQFHQRLREMGEYLRSSRPTAVNLGWAVDRVSRAVAATKGGTARELWDVLEAEAIAIAREDVETCRRIGEAGASLVPQGGAALTHCNAGALATAGIGTALALFYAAREQGREFRVFADETRPLLQGARLTALELAAAGIDVTVLCDGMAASLMASGGVQMVVVGADRIAANGDVANKIGTYGVAIAARYHKVPFYVAAPRSTFDLTLPNGAAIPIETRAAEEVGGIAGGAVPPGVACHNPAFDVTPAELITAIVTEMGLIQPVNRDTVAALVGQTARQPS